MKITLLTVLMVVVSSSGSVADSGGIQRVSWLQGCWAAISSERVIEEHWMAPRGASMLGIGRTVRGERLVEYELVVIREQGNQLAYEAHPSGQPMAVFLSKALSASSVLFENLEHDFPQRIGYERQGVDSLVAWIEGTQAGRSRRVDFPFRRAACPGN